MSGLTPSPAAPGTRDALRIGFREFDLDNGLHVILHRDAHLPIVAVNLWYHVGSKNEREGKTGFAHLFEHMMFQGSANVAPNGHFRHVQEAGGTLNGSTSFDRTNYYETLPSHRLELGLWLESDRMRSLALTSETLETQRSVVMEERRARYDNQPYGTMFEHLFSRAWKLQPYRWPTIGSMTDIRAAVLDDVRDFHTMYYRPANASLCIAGDIDEREAEELVLRHFADIPNGPGEPFRPFVREPRQLVQVRDYVYDNVPLPALAVAMHIPDLNDPGFAAFDVLSQVLSSGDSSRLHQSMVYHGRAAQSVMTFAFGLELPGVFLFRATAQPGAAPEEIERLLWDELARIRTEGVAEAELAKARNRLEAAFVHDVTSMQSRADMLNAYRILSGDTSLIHGELDRIRAVTRDDVQRAAEAHLVEHNATVLYCLPYPKESA